MEERYVLISDISRVHFEQSINEWIRRGYQPAGGVCVTVETLTDTEFDPKGTPTPVYYQALIK